MESFSFLIHLEGKSIAYSGDIDHIDELEPMLDGIDLLILETAHVDPADVFPYLTNRNIDRIVLSHIHPALEKQVSSLHAAAGDKRITLATDGLRISL
jgi:ribonuclease BN (tRNA processing enzyme)